MDSAHRSRYAAANVKDVSRYFHHMDIKKSPRMRYTGGGSDITLKTRSSSRKAISRCREDSGTGSAGVGPALGHRAGRSNQPVSLNGAPDSMRQFRQPPMIRSWQSKTKPMNEYMYLQEWWVGA
jgi:hypothetical protein